MAEENLITSLKTTIGNEELKYDIGAVFKNIFYNNENNYTLLDFFNHMDTFLKQNLFTYYGSEEPTSNNINIWYETPKSQ